MAGFLRLALERAQLVSLLALVGAAGWAFVGWMTLDMGHPWVVLMMPTSAFWGPETVIAVGMMWAMMMVAMMLPSAAPMIATFDGLERRKTGPATEPWRTPVFVAGYLVIWIGFSVAATALQWSLQAMGLVTPMAESSSPWLTSGLLAIAGLYQFSPLKEVCLRYCRSPIGFLMMEWRPGVSGAWVMGLKHGSYCLGCCGAVMLLLFVAGAMNLAWIVFLTAIVAAEKLLPPTVWMTRAIGGLFLLAGLVLLAMS
jgi:predicted metal-binding membrane protein